VAKARQRKRITRRKRAVAAFADMIQNPKARQGLTPETYEKKVTKWLEKLDLTYEDIPQDVHELQDFMVSHHVKGLYEDIPATNPPPGTLAKL
jgi:hypothetical protein